MRLLALVLVSLPAFSQLELYSKAEQEVIPSSYEMGQAGTGSSLSREFRIRNTGEATVQLTRLRVSGTGFRMTGAPSLPHFVVPGSNVDFTVVFTPADYGWYSANLEINGKTYMLRAQGYASAALYFEGRLVQPGETIDFGSIERGGFRTLQFELRNTTTTVVGTRTVYTSGGVFTIPAGNQSVILDPGQSLQFRVEFKPRTAGVFREQLQIDRTSTWFLTGTATEPPLPAPTLVLETPVIRSGDQGRVSVALQRASSGKGKGRLTIELRGGAADSAVQFVNGAKTVEFDVVEGTSAISTRDMTFQAGTTAGTITITAEVGGYRDQLAMAINPDTVRIEKGVARRAGQMLEVQLTGFDNTRTVSEMRFTFFDTAGQPLPNGPITVPASAEFALWWEASTLGGVFTSKAVFPVAGDATLVGGVIAEISNSAGQAKTDKLMF